MHKNKIGNLARLILDNAAKPRDFRVVNEKADEATVYVYGVIGGYWGDVDAQSFASALAAIDAKVIHLRINSPGGDVFDARAMMAAIKQHSAKVIGHIDGMAASAATDICMACDEIKIVKGGRFMIHNAWTLAIGNKSDLRDTADILEGVDNDIADDYVARTGRERSEIIAWMDAETWMTAEQAKERGFADEVVEVVSGTKNLADWDLSAYANAPKPEEKPQPDPEAVRASLERRFRLLAQPAAA